MHQQVEAAFPPATAQVLAWLQAGQIGLASDIGWFLGFGADVRGSERRARLLKQKLTLAQRRR